MEAAAKRPSEKGLVTTAIWLVIGSVLLFGIVACFMEKDDPAARVEKLKQACAKEFPNNERRAEACVLSAITKFIDQNDRAAMERARRSSGF